MIFTLKLKVFKCVFLWNQAREEYRLEKYRKKVEWAVDVIQRQYVQWKVRMIRSPIDMQQISIIIFLHFIVATKISINTTHAITAKYFKPNMLWMDGCAEVLNRNFNAIKSYLSQMEGNWIILFYVMDNVSVRVSFLQCHKYRKRFDSIARSRMREKVTASIIFKDRKSSYDLRLFSINSL